MDSNIFPSESFAFRNRLMVLLGVCASSEAPKPLWWDSSRCLLLRSTERREYRVQRQRSAPWTAPIRASLRTTKFAGQINSRFRNRRSDHALIMMIDREQGDYAESAL